METKALDLFLDNGLMACSCNDCQKVEVNARTELDALKSRRADDKRIENFVSHITVYCVKNIPATPGDSCDDVIINAYERIKTRLAEAEDALQKIYDWSCAYPLDIFPEPDFEKAHRLLKSGGMTLDSISASNMRYVVEGVGKIARAFLHPAEEKQ
jgi:hypothetical protein